MKNRNRPGIEQAAKAALIQKHQLEAAEAQLGGMSQHVEDLTGKNATQAEELARLESRMTSLRASTGGRYLIDHPKQGVGVRRSLELNEVDKVKIEDSISGLKFTAPFIDFDGDWTGYVREVEEYARYHGVSLAQDPFDSLLSKQQKANLLQSIEQDLKQPNDCDKWDYVIAASCGVLAGLVDAFFVGVPGKDSILGRVADQGADRLVERFASVWGWKGSSGSSDSTTSAIRFLEKEFSVNYDHKNSVDVNGKLAVGPKDHHLKSLAHSPSPVGLFFSVLDQITNKASYVFGRR